MRRPWREFLRSTAWMWLAAVICFVGATASVSRTAAGPDSPSRVENGQPAPTVPEPRSVFLIGAGLVGLGLILRRF